MGYCYSLNGDIFPSEERPLLGLSAIRSSRDKVLELSYAVPFTAKNARKG